MGASASTMTIHAMDKETFQQLAPDHFSNSLFHSPKNTEGLIPPEQLRKFASQATDCFLTHDWGKDELNRDNHARVAKINARLKELGFRTWFDEEMMLGDIQQQMADGIDNAACVIVFITERYMTKVQGKGAKGQLDNCLFEFSHISSSKDRNKIFPVVMEPRCRDTSAWFGKVNFTLGNQLYVDFSSDENVEAVADDIANKMRQVLTDGLTVSERWSKFSERMSSDQKTSLQSESESILTSTSPLESLDYELAVKLLIHLGCPKAFYQNLSEDMKQLFNGEFLNLLENAEELVSECKLSDLTPVSARIVFKKLQNYKEKGITESLFNQLQQDRLEASLPVKASTIAISASSENKEKMDVAVNEDTDNKNNMIPSLPPAQSPIPTTLKECHDDMNTIKIIVPTALTVCRLNDGQLAFGNKSGEITIFNIQTRQHLIIKAHKEFIRSLIQLSNGRLISGSNDKLIKIWNLTTQTCEITLTGHESVILSLCELSEGRLVSGSVDKSIKVWNLRSGNCEQTLLGHGNIVTSVVQLSDNDNTAIASASEDNTIRIWDTETGSCIRVIEEAGSRLIKLSDNRLASNAPNSEIKIWNYVTGSCERVLNHGEKVKCLLQLSDGRLVSGSKGFIKIWNIYSTSNNNGDCLLHTLSHEGRGATNGLLQIVDNRVLSVWHGADKNSFSSKVTLWSLRCSEAISKDVMAPREEIEESESKGKHVKNEVVPSLSPDTVLTLGSYEPSKKITIPQALSVCELQDGRLAFGTDRDINITDLQTEKHFIIKAHNLLILSLLQLSDGRLVTGSGDKLIKIWNLTTQTCEITLRGHTNWVRSLCELSNDRLVSGSQDKSIKVWNLHSGNCEKTLLGHSKSVISIIQLSDNDNTMIASASYDDTIRIWNIETESCIRVIEGAGNRLIKLSDNRLASNTGSHRIKIWNYLSGNCEHIINHDEYVESLLHLSDGRLVSGSENYLKIWNIHNNSNNNGDWLLQTLSHEEKREYYGGLIEMSDSRILSVRCGSKDTIINIWKIRK